MNNTPPVPDSATDSTTSDSTPSHEQILFELEQVATSDVFAGAARQQRLLRHLVSRRLNGSLGDLKEYTLGVEVFDRGEDFDPRLDPIVRVEASRLRSRLQRYYDGPGAGDPVRILLPRGAYIPAFTGPPAASAPAAISLAPGDPATSSIALSSGDQVPEVEPGRGPVAPAVSGEPVKSRTRALIWLAAALGVVVLAVVLVPRRSRIAVPGSGQFTRFRRITNDELLSTWPTFSPDDQSIAYARRDAGNWELYVRDLKNPAVTELTPGSLDDNTQPSWSPDGSQIAFRSERDGGGIFLLDIRSHAVRRISAVGYSPSWSPDSKRVVYATGNFTDPVETGFGTSKLAIVDIASARVARLGTAQGPFGAMQPAWSPHGQRIAYWDTDANGDRDIWTIGANGAPPVPLTHDGWTDWDPTWSPDGKYVYFASDRGGSMNLWRVSVDEASGAAKGEPEAVTTPSSYSGWISFAHNGKQFAYVRHTPFNELCKTPFEPGKEVDLMQRTQLTSGERSMHEPDMSPDSKWIVVRIQDPQEDLALIKSDGSEFRRLTNDIYTERDPHWSPDGKQITFVSNRNRMFQVWSIRPDGSGLRQLTQRGAMPRAWTPDGVLAGYPADGPPIALDPPGATVKSYGLPPVLRPISWSPDRTEVAGRMRGNAFGQSSLFIFTPANQDYWEVSPNAANASTMWLGNGQQLVFSRSEGIYVADVGTHQVKVALPIARRNIHSRVTMSKDGHTLYFVQADDQEDIWTAGE